MIQKTQTIIRVGGDVEKQKPSYIAGGKVLGCNILRKNPNEIFGQPILLLLLSRFSHI